MSYDILLYPREAGTDWNAILEADEADTPQEVLNDEAAMSSGVETFRRIEARLRKFVTGDVDIWVAEETGGDILGQFTAADSGLQVELYHGSAAVMLPFREEPHAPGMHIKVREAVRIVAEETGYEAYDPQTGTDFDGTVHDMEARAAWLANRRNEQDEVLEGVVVPDDASGLTAPPSGEAQVLAGDTVPEGVDVPTEEAPKDPRQERIEAILAARRDPRRVRRRAIFDLILTVLIVIWVAWRRNQGETGFLTTVLMILAVMNLASGLLGLRAARRLAAEEEEKGVQDRDGTPPTAPPAV